MAEIICCGRVVRAQKGKTPTCSACGTEYRVIRHTQKWSNKKQAARSHSTMKDSIYLLGLFFIIAALVALGIGLSNLWNNGFASFRMESFSVIVLLGLCGFVIVKMYGKRRKA